MLRAIESDTNLVTTEAVHLVQFVQPSFLLVYEANPPGPTRVAVVFTIGDDEIVVQDITLS